MGLQMELCASKASEVSPDQILSGQACAKVTNPTGKTRMLSNLHLTDFHFRKPDGLTSDARVLLVDPPKSVAIASLESMTLLLKFDSLDDKQVRGIQPSTYVAFLSGSDTDNATSPPSLREIPPLTVRLTVPGPKAAVANLTAWAYREWPWAEVENYRFTIPLAEETVWPYSNRRYVLQTETGSIAIVNSVPADARVPVQDLSFVIGDFANAGKYSGQVGVSPDESNGVVVNINVKDHFVWPLLVMMLGILIAHLAKQSVQYMMEPSDKPVHESLMRYLVRPSTGDVFRSGTALLIAILTAFKTLYVGKPFGTLSDYINIVLSGAAVKVSVDLFAFGMLRALHFQSRAPQFGTKSKRSDVS
jgi:hypothetical protein